mmetsp:Transcript_29314/g.73738  ORF Transcript_29314/g.73738 Transcript_29314/m.73738 type:complete len:566 (-) Transcript_29314:199-1896(-)
METKGLNKLHVVLLGKSEVGKTSMLLTYLGQQAAATPYRPTMLDHFVVRATAGRQQNITLSIFDLGGKCDSLLQLCIPRADVALLCFSIDSHQSLEETGKWLQQAQGRVASLHAVLVGLKSDLREDKHQRDLISRRRCEAAADTLGCPYFEVSCLHALSVGALFRHVVEWALDNPDREERKERGGGDSRPIRFVSLSSSEATPKTASLGSLAHTIALSKDATSRRTSATDKRAPLPRNDSDVDLGRGRRIMATVSPVTLSEAMDQPASRKSSAVLKNWAAEQHRHQQLAVDASRLAEGGRRISSPLIPPQSTGDLADSPTSRTQFCRFRSCDDVRLKKAGKEKEKTTLLAHNLAILRKSSCDGRESSRKRSLSGSKGLPSPLLSWSPTLKEAGRGGGADELAETPCTMDSSLSQSECTPPASLESSTGRMPQTSPSLPVLVNMPTAQSLNGSLHQQPIPKQKPLFSRLPSLSSVRDIVRGMASSLTLSGRGSHGHDSPPASPPASPHAPVPSSVSTSTLHFCSGTPRSQRGARGNPRLRMSSSPRGLSVIPSPNRRYFSMDDSGD